MPGVSGIEATSRCRSMGISTPIIILSADPLVNLEAAQEAGANLILEKPASATIIQETFERLNLSNVASC